MQEICLSNKMGAALEYSIFVHIQGLSPSCDLSDSGHLVSCQRTLFSIVMGSVSLPTA